MGSHATVALGISGENLACHELARQGYAILATRYRTRVGEIDIIARDGETLVFVEVKTRSSEDFGVPAEAVTWRKQRRIVTDGEVVPSARSGCTGASAGSTSLPSSAGPACSRWWRW